jgi:hypothetical protein
MDTTDPIRRVPVVSTGQVKTRPDHRLAQAIGLAPTLAAV